MKKTLSNIFYSCCSQLLAIIVPLITSPYLSRVLKPTSLGIYTYIDSVSQVFMMIGLIGLSNYGIREIAYLKNNKEERSKVFFEIMLLRIFLLVLTYILYCFFMRNSIYGRYSLLQIIWFAGSFLDIVWLFNGMEDFKTVVLRTFMVKAATVFLIVIFIKSPKDLEKYIILMGMCQIFGALICYANLKKIICLINFHELNFFRHVIPTLKIALPEIVTLIYYQMDKIMLEFLLKSPEIIAFYDLGQKIVRIPVTAITAISTVMLPRNSRFIIENDTENLRNSIQIMIDFSIMLILPMCFGLMAIAYGFVPWFYGDGYMMVAPIIIALCPVIIARGLSSISGAQYLIPSNNTKYLTISSSFSAILNVIINYIAIPIFGVYGAVLGTILAEYSVTFIQFYYMRKNIKIKNMCFNFFKYGLFSLIAVLPVCFTYKYLKVSILSTIIEIFVAIIIYTLLLYITKDNFTKMLKKMIK